MVVFEFWIFGVYILFFEFYFMNLYFGLGFFRSRRWDKSLSVNNLCGSFFKRILVKEWKNKVGKEKVNKVYEIKLVIIVDNWSLGFLGNFWRYLEYV